MLQKPINLYEEEDYGEVLISNDNGKTIIDKVKIANYVECHYKDDRTMSVMKLIDGTYILSVENPPLSDRAIKTTMRLSKESLIGMFSAISIFFNCSANGNGDYLKLMQEALDNDDIKYSYSDNLHAFDKNITL